jgi:6-phosphogluconolactonase
LYTLCELSSTLVTHTLPPLPEKQGVSKGGTPSVAGVGQPGAPVCISRHSILPPADKDNQSKMLASEILLLPSPTPGGKHLLICTNRDSPNPEGDAVALFSVDDEGKVERTEQGWIMGVGKHLRGMSADKEGKYVAVAGRDGGGLTIFERDLEKGLTLKEVAKLEVEQVVCPLWID